MSEAFGIADTPQAAAKLRALPVDRLLQWTHDANDVDFGVVIDSWSVPRQPVVSFALGRQAHVPVLVSSNADETTVFGKSLPLAVENSRPKTIAQYRAWLKNEFGEFAEEVWQAYPARADNSVPRVFIRMQTDYAFGFGADRLARAMTAEGKPAYLYYFTYHGRGEFASLGAFHSEELMFLSDDYWKSWVSDANDRRLAGNNDRLLDAICQNRRSKPVQSTKVAEVCCRRRSVPGTRQGSGSAPDTQPGWIFRVRTHFESASR